MLPRGSAPHRVDWSAGNGGLGCGCTTSSTTTRASGRTREFAIFGDRRISYGTGAARGEPHRERLRRARARSRASASRCSRRTASISALLLRRLEGGRRAGAAQLPARGAGVGVHRATTRGARLLVARGELVARSMRSARRCRACGAGSRSTRRRRAGWEDLRAWVARRSRRRRRSRPSSRETISTRCTRAARPAGRRAPCSARARSAPTSSQLVRSLASAAPASASLIVAPLYHAAAAITAFFAVARGASLFIHGGLRRRPRSCARCRRSGIARATLVPAMIQACLVHGARRRRRAATTTCASSPTARRRSPSRRCAARSRCSAATSSRATA